MNPALTFRKILFWLIALGLALTLVGWSLSQTRLVSAQGALSQANPQTLAKGGSLLGEDLAPASPAPAGAVEPASVPHATSQATTCSQWHTVLAGETLHKIGLRYNVSWRRLAEINNLANPNLIYAGSKLCVQASGTTPPPSTGRIPTFTIVEVVRDDTVTIKTSNFPASDRFDVLMGKIGTRGVNGIRVERIDSGDGGTFTATFEIPAVLKGQRQIAIRLQSPTSGYYSYNWFYNNTTHDGGSDPGDPPVGGLPPGKIPTFTIVEVVRDDTVTIKTANFPANDRFEVLLGKIGTRGVNGIRVERIDSGDGGTFTATFEIPAALKGQRQIAIRLQSPTSGYYSFNWFYNNTAP